MSTSLLSEMFFIPKSQKQGTTACSAQEDGARRLSGTDLLGRRARGGMEARVVVSVVTERR